MKAGEQDIGGEVTYHCRGTPIDTLTIPRPESGDIHLLLIMHHRDAAKDEYTYISTVLDEGQVDRIVKHLCACLTGMRRGREHSGSIPDRLVDSLALFHEPPTVEDDEDTP